MLPPIAASRTILGRSDSATALDKINQLKLTVEYVDHLSMGRSIAWASIAQEAKAVLPMRCIPQASSRYLRHGDGADYERSARS